MDNFTSFCCNSHEKKLVIAVFLEAGNTSFGCMGNIKPNQQICLNLSTPSIQLVCDSDSDINSPRWERETLLAGKRPQREKLVCPNGSGNQGLFY